MSAIAIRLGKTYGPITQEYAHRVSQVGGRVPRSTVALKVLDTLLYGQYNNGAGGTGSVSEFLHLFAVLWSPLSNFAGTVIPIIGPTFTNVGHVAGDWNLADGFLGNTSSHLDTNTTPLVFTSQQEQGIGFWSNSYSQTLANQLMGHAASGGSPATHVGLPPTGSANYAYRVRSGAGLTAPTNASPFIYAYRSDASTVGLYRNTTLSTTSNTDAGPGTRNFYFGARNTNGTATLHWTNRYHSGWLVNGILTPAMVNIFYNAMVAANTSRATL